MALASKLVYELMLFRMSEFSIFCSSFCLKRSQSADSSLSLGTKVSLVQNLGTPISIFSAKWMSLVNSVTSTVVNGTRLLEQVHKSIMLPWVFVGSMGLTRTWSLLSIRRARFLPFLSKTKEHLTVMHRGICHLYAFWWQNVNNVNSEILFICIYVQAWSLRFWSKSQLQ